jgi:cytochrome b involved in lipid metabolism
MADRQISVGELRLHTKIPGDVWIVVDQVVWDIGDFASAHPGGAESQISLSR